MICGVDVSLKSLEVRIGRDGLTATFLNTVEGIAALADFCQAQDVHLVAILNPRSVRRFAEAMGLLEKTDGIDCGVIAWFTETKRCVACTPASAEQQRLKALVTRLRQLTDLRAMQSNQRTLVTDREVLASFTKMLRLLNAQIRTLEVAIAGLIDADPLWRQLDTAFRTIKGVADRTVARLMAELPEIGTLSNKAISKLVGLAPLAHDSGNTHGKRPVRGGRRSIRDILYWVAGGVARHHPDFLAFRQRLAAAGKPKKVIRVALAHKLLVRLNAQAREVRNQFTGGDACLVPAS